ncbi:MAG: rhomboid family intramembrane serine protease [Pseudomonadota bacterium]
MFPLKDERRAFGRPTVTFALLAVNAAICAYSLLANDVGIGRLATTAGTIPYEITHMVDIGPPAIVPLPLTMITGLFVHGGLLHLLGNMLYLWIFGPNVEGSMGHPRFAGFYLLCGFVAAFIQILVAPDGKLPIVGASGAIAGLLGAYAVLFPRARIQTLLFIRVVRVPAFILLAGWFLLQLSGAGQGGAVAWHAHIGGFAAGFVLARAFTERYRYSGGGTAGARRR